MGKPKVLRFYSAEDTKKKNELATMKWDGEKWFLKGKHADIVKDIIGGRGMYYGGTVFTIRDRDLYKPLTMGYSGIQVDTEEEETDDNIN
jgi:hypothetical protein